ncbi:MAG: TM2 domain-containing protein [Parabacteroides sp.]|nr:TM2 domain-containing protein [Parabacteroides sp.]
MKNKTTAALLAIFVGGLGVHKFYLKKTFQGIIYLLFCWTCIPAIVACIEGVLFLLSTESEFNQKYNKH